MNWLQDILFPTFYTNTNIITAVLLLFLTSFRICFGGRQFSSTHHLVHCKHTSLLLPTELNQMSCYTLTSDFSHLLNVVFENSDVTFTWRRKKVNTGRSYSVLLQHRTTAQPVIILATSTKPNRCWMHTGSGSINNWTKMSLFFWSGCRRCSVQSQWSALKQLCSSLTFTRFNRSKLLWLFSEPPDWFYYYWWKLRTEKRQELSFRCWEKLSSRTVNSAQSISVRIYSN